MATVNTATSTTGLISSAGIGSGLDVKSIVKAMVDAESQPMTDLQTQASAMQTKLSALGSVKSYLAAFRDAASKLSQPATWNATTGSSSSTSTVSVSTDTGAAAGSYAVSVSRLATAQTLSSRVFGASEAVGAGNLTLQGTAADAPAAVSIAITATDTLAQVRDKVNASDSGITAHIQTDSSGSRLVLQSKVTGADHAFKVGTSGAGGLADLAYDPAASSNPMTLQQESGNAQAKINGVDVSSDSNTLTNVLDGITLTLSGITAANTPTMVTVQPDTSTLKASITAMVTAYNSLQNYLASQTKYDAATKTAATLQGDGTANSVRDQLRTMMGSSSTASSTFTRFSDVGFDLQKDGTVVVNSSKLDKAIANPVELRKLFANSDTAVAANNGVATQLRKLSDSILGADGVLTARTNGIQSSISYNSKRQADMQVRIDKYQARVQAQYNSLDTQMASLNSLSTYMTQQITQMNKSTA